MSLNLMNKKLEYWEHQLLDLGKRNKMIKSVLLMGKHS